MPINPTLNRDIIQRLRFDADRFESVIGGPGVARFLVNNGRAYDRIANELPKPGIPNGCFYNAMALAMDTALTYVEGVARRQNSPLDLEHAWCVDTDGRIYDPTWDPPGIAYFGVPFCTEYVKFRFNRQYETRKTVGSLILTGDTGFDLVGGTAEGWEAR